MLRQQPQARDGPGFIVGKTHERGASDKPHASTMRMAARRNGGSPGCHLGLPFPCPAAVGDCPLVPPAGAGIRGFRTAGDLRAPDGPGLFVTWDPRRPRPEGAEERDPGSVLHALGGALASKAAATHADAAQHDKCQLGHGNGQHGSSRTRGSDCRFGTTVVVPAETHGHEGVGDGHQGRHRQQVKQCPRVVPRTVCAFQAGNSHGRQHEGKWYTVREGRKNPNVGHAQDHRQPGDDPGQRPPGNRRNRRHRGEGRGCDPRPQHCQGGHVSCGRTCRWPVPAHRGPASGRRSPRGAA